MALTLKSLLQKGYFPKELPPPFNTRSFGQFASAATNLFQHSPKGTSRPEIFNLARSGTLRRPLAILNPVQFFRLASYVVQNWAAIQSHLRPSRFSLTLPTPGRDRRAIGRRYGLNRLPERRAKLRSRGRFILQADISRFYPSIYTHSVAWATETKAWAKNPANRKIPCLGNDLDRLLQNCQDGQTNGIPIGPDTSLVIAEIILSKVDASSDLARLNGIRYIDDYEFVFDSEADALAALSVLQERLIEFELHLNPAKSQINSLPQSLQERWVGQLHEFDLDPSKSRFAGSLVRFFDDAFELARRYPSDGVLKYAVGRLANLTFTAQFELVEDLITQAARVEAGALPIVLEILLTRLRGQTRRTRSRADLLSSTILDHAPQRHSSEVAWALWGCLALGASISDAEIQGVINMEDSICALLALHARERGLVRSPALLSALDSIITTTQLYDTRWLLAYEAAVQGWITKIPDPVSQDQNFNQLKTGGVHFYDKTKLRFPRRRRPQTPGVFGTGHYPDSSFLESTSDETDDDDFDSTPDED